MIDDRNREFLITTLAICHINLSLLVGSAIRQWGGQPKNRGLIPGKGKKNVCIQSIHTGSGTHPASNPLCTRIKVATQFRLVPKSSMCGAVSPLSYTPSFGEQIQLCIFHFTFSPKYSLQCFVLRYLISQPETNFCMAFRFSTQQTPTPGGEMRQCRCTFKQFADRVFCNVH